MCASSPLAPFFVQSLEPHRREGNMTGAAAADDDDYGGGGEGGGQVEFRKVAVGESRLWQTRRIRHADLNRLHLRSVESILDPTVSADSIIGV